MNENTGTGDKLPRLYSDLSGWFHLLTAPEDYGEEAAFYQNVITENSRIPVETVLEMGSGGGNNALHLKSYFTLTLTDLSEDMLDISRTLNPECEHIQGDMRHLRLDRQFDAVFVHDAVSYITELKDLKNAVETAYIHCKPGGAVLFCPDNTCESFRTQTRHGGHDKGNRGLRYLEWVWDPDASDTSYFLDFAYLFRENGKVWCESERHVLGLFPEKDWIDCLVSAGFTQAKAVLFSIGEYNTPVFAGIKPE
jgi:hypothetical protein